MPIVRNVIKPQNKHKNPTGRKKKFSCKIPCVSIYSTDTAFRKIQAIPKQRKIPPMAIEIRFIFALFVSLPSLISFSVKLFIVFPPNIRSSSETENSFEIAMINSGQADFYCFPNWKQLALKHPADLLIALESISFPIAFV